MWCVGVCFAATIGVWGVICCVTQHATTLNVRLRGMVTAGQSWGRVIDALQAATFGWTLIAITAFIHFQWFWGNHVKLRRYHEIGKYAAALAVVVSVIAHGWSWMAR